MENAHARPETRAFADLLDQIAALRDGAVTGPVTGTVTGTVTGGHHDLGPDIWLSGDPGGRAVLTSAPCEGGFRLSLEAGDSGAWACLGMRLPVDVLRGARYLGLLIEVAAGDVMSFTPSLRYFLAQGTEDVPTPAPVFLAGGARAHLAHIPLDAGLLAGSAQCELNLFFNSDHFEVDFIRLEPLAMW